MHILIVSALKIIPYIFENDLYLYLRARGGVIKQLANSESRVIGRFSNKDKGYQVAGYKFKRYMFSISEIPVIDFRLSVKDLNNLNIKVTKFGDTGYRFFLEKRKKMLCKSPFYCNKCR